MGRYILNANINSVRGAVNLLKEIDLSRIEQLGLESKCDLYMSNGSGSVGEWSMQFVGTALPINGLNREPHTQEIILPSPTFEPKSLPAVDKVSSYMPAYFLFNTPSRLEFSLRAETAREYLGMNGAIRHLFPDLIVKGYDRSNADHSSIAWFYAYQKGNNNPEPLVYVGPGGLVFNEDMNRIGKLEIFTQNDLTRFSRLKESRGILTNVSEVPPEIMDAIKVMSPEEALHRLTHPKTC